MSQNVTEFLLNVTKLCGMIEIIKKAKSQYSLCAGFSYAHMEVNHAP
nr:MAG TPA: hypothetical protein [Bacteriophage sp.]